MAVVLNSMFFLWTKWAGEVLNLVLFEDNVFMGRGGSNIKGVVRRLDCVTEYVLSVNICHNVDDLRDMSNERKQQMCVST